MLSSFSLLDESFDVLASTTKTAFWLFWIRNIILPKKRSTHTALINRRKMETKSWKSIKDEIYGVEGTSRRDQLEREASSFSVGLWICNKKVDKRLSTF